MLYLMALQIAGSGTRKWMRYDCSSWVEWYQQGKQKYSGGNCRKFGANLCHSTAHSKLATKTGRRRLIFMSGMFI